MPDLTTLGIADAGRLMARGELTSTALTETFLHRIKAVDHKIASYITVTAELALAAAHQADMEMKGGVRRGPMHGIPVALSVIPRASAAPPASSRLMAWSAVAASSRSPSASTPRDRSPGRSRIAR